MSFFCFDREVMCCNLNLEKNIRMGRDWSQWRGPARLMMLYKEETWSQRPNLWRERTKGEKGYESCE